MLSPGILPFNQKLDSQDYGDYPDYGSQIAPGDLEGPLHQTLSTEVRDVLQIRSEHIRTFSKPNLKFILLILSFHILLLFINIINNILK